MQKKWILLALITSITTSAWAQTYRAVIHTTRGKIKLELFDQTPKHRDNFIKLAKEKVYDGLLFHRVIPNFMIQGGDPSSKNAPAGKMLGDGDLGYTIPAEFIPNYFHKKGALAQARDDNPAKASSASQFYIVVGKKYTDADFERLEKRGLSIPEERKSIYKKKGGTPFLDGSYTVYGQVLKGMDVVEQIINVPRDMNDRPLQNEKIKTIKIKRKILGIWL